MSKWAEMTNRERDAALAEMMGWTGVDQSFPFEDDEWVGCPPDSILHCLTAPSFVPHYTTYTTAAIGIAEKMREKGWDWRIDCLCYLEASYGVWFGRPNENTPAAIYANTLPAAICEAAWKALGGE